MPLLAPLSFLSVSCGHCASSVSTSGTPASATSLSAVEDLPDFPGNPICCIQQRETGGQVRALGASPFSAINSKRFCMIISPKSVSSRLKWRFGPDNLWSRSASKRLHSLPSWLNSEDQWMDHLTYTFHPSCRKRPTSPPPDQSIVRGSKWVNEPMEDLT